MANGEFTYTQKQIGSIRVLAKTLSITEEELINLSNNSDKYYNIAKKVPKTDGTTRLTYKVSPPLRIILDKIRTRIIKNVDLPYFIMAGVPNRSYIDNALSHKNSIMVQSEDITKFFDSIKSLYVFNVFKFLFKFPPIVADVLTKLCTFKGSLVQGSPLSGDIANLIFFEKESKLAQLAKNLNLNYTRYYDDIYISSKEKTFHEHVGKLRSKIYGMFASIEVEPNKSPTKSRLMKSSERIDVHDVTVNSHKLSPSKKRISRVRFQIDKLRKDVLANSNIEEIITLYRSTIGQVNTLKAQGSPKYKKMLNEVNEIISQINPVLAKRYARSIRKAKNQNELNKINQKVSPLKKISPSVAGVINAEIKTAKEKMKLRNCS
ncbi:reverse transcriptase family protein [Pseudoalteromonas haloplanktis]|uniref:Reverse transcriptase family protein n=1 Tax=Pseudoalteromonas haloplanktis TaxID=228 RepID=A0ABU1BGN0_PSEHA|nr:reverse transcriptase family protein [Pseudoalteromonas haloplanktis]MDQ9093084.1 reverse transcriptase family protein [Pseudoalteromonas haloplanktis]